MSSDQIPLPGDERSAFTPGDFASELRRLESREDRHFLEGGQAVNLWAEVYGDTSPALDGLAPFTSKDCDIWIGPDLLKEIEQVLDGRLIRAKSPADGQLGIFQLSGFPNRTIDLLDGVFGLTRTEVKRAWERSNVVGGIRTIDPILLFKGKCHNFIHLPQDGRNDERHIRILLAILPSHFDALLDLCLQGIIEERAVISDVKLLLGFSRDKWVRAALAKLDLKLRVAIPWETFRSCRLEVIERFSNSTGQQS